MKYLMLLLIYCHLPRAQAHPVGYQDSVMYMGNFQEEMAEHTLIYSPRPWLGIAAYGKVSETAEAYGPQVGLLLKRWNELDSQGNLYILGGMGRVKESQRETETYSRYGARADYETRKIYTAFEYTKNESGHWKDEELVSRLGFAPYLANVDELNVWFIVENRSDLVAHKNNPANILRFYYKNVLWEVGSTWKGSWLFNIMFTY